MAIQNPCEGEGQAPRRRRVTPRDLGTKFGGKTRGECPEHGCDAGVTPGGRIRRHEVDPGRFEHVVSTHT